MIAVPAGVRVLVATKPVDFRRGADSLAALAREELQRDPFSGDLRLPLEASGPAEDFGLGRVRLVLFWKRLSKTRFAGRRSATA